MNEAFFEIHSGLDREGPGERDCLDWALGLAPVARDAAILDAGCGPGADIEGLLDHAPKGHVTAVDLHAPFIDRINARYEKDKRVTARVDDMLDQDGPFDLIWCSAAIYSVGVDAALAAWKDQLTDSGAIVFSEAIYRSEDRPAEVDAFWSEGYPEMTTREGLMDRVHAAGFRVLGTRMLPDSAWEAYYTPLGRRVALLRSGEVTDEMSDALDAEEAEIALWRTHGDAFGYLRVVAVPL